MEKRPVDARGPAEPRGLVQGAHMVKYSHAVHEDTVHTVRHVSVAPLQVLEVLLLLVVLFLQSLYVLTVYPDGERRGPVQELFQLRQKVYRQYAGVTLSYTNAPLKSEGAGFYNNSSDGLQDKSQVYINELFLYTYIIYNKANVHMEFFLSIIFEFIRINQGPAD